MLVYQRVFSKVQPFFNQLSQLQAPPWRVTSHTHQAAFPHWSHKLGRPEPADPDTSWIRRRIGDVFMKHGDLYDKHRDNVTNTSQNLEIYHDLCDISQNSMDTASENRDITIPDINTNWSVLLHLSMIQWSTAQGLRTENEGYPIIVEVKPKYLYI
jgi:hypothetical protein